MATHVGLIAALLMATFSVAKAVADPVAAPVEETAFSKLTHDVALFDITGTLQATAPRRRLEMRNVRIVDPVAATVTSGQTVIVMGSRVTWVGDTDKTPEVKDVVVIDGAGRFLSPGLTDMHIHSARADGWLLNLAAGVTSVRDMDGFPWILAARDAIYARRMLGPIDYVAGTIIAAAPLEGYAVIASNPEEGRRLVRQQAACGYDFIKVHNVLPQPTFDAVANQAAILGMDLVGHVPHDITLDHALHVGQMRTTEHLKGFLIDQTLLPSTEDFAMALAGVQTWITPTLYTRYGYDRGDWARAELAGPLARYVSPQTRRQWAWLLAHPDKDDLASLQRLSSTQTIVMKRLIPLHPHWLAGTDAAGYPFNVMGFALLDELLLLQDEGLSPPEVLRSATTEPAAAMRQPGEFGQIAKGMRADMVLLDQNPLEGVDAFRSNEGVMAHGYWLSRANLDHALDQVAIDYAADSDLDLTREAVEALLTHLASARSTGAVFESRTLADLSDKLRAARLGDLADRIDTIAVAPRDGPCAEILPS